MLYLFIQQKRHVIHFLRHFYIPFCGFHCSAGHRLVLSWLTWLSGNEWHRLTGRPAPHEAVRERWTSALQDGWWPETHPFAAIVIPVLVDPTASKDGCRMELPLFPLFPPKTTRTCPEREGEQERASKEECLQFYTFPNRQLLPPCHPPTFFSLLGLFLTILTCLSIWI